MKELTFYTRAGCHLCDEALEDLRQVQQELPFALRVVDLAREASAEKRQLYTNEVPVMELDGRKVMKYRLDEDRFRRLLLVE